MAYWLLLHDEPDIMYNGWPDIIYQKYITSYINY